MPRCTSQHPQWHLRRRYAAEAADRNAAADGSDFIAGLDAQMDAELDAEFDAELDAELAADACDAGPADAVRRALARWLAAKSAASSAAQQSCKPDSAAQPVGLTPGARSLSGAAPDLPVTQNSSAAVGTPGGAKVAKPVAQPAAIPQPAVAQAAAVDRAAEQLVAPRVEATLPVAAAQATPYWIPAGVDVTALPAELRGAIAGIINPSYQTLVLEAAPGLDQSTGLTIVHLLWLEMIDQLELAAAPHNPPVDLVSPPGPRRADLLARHLRLVHAKLKASELLLRLKEFKSCWGPVSPPRSSAHPGADGVHVFLPPST